MEKCKHPRVQIVAREDDAEFVECLECGEIFESSEFKDMAIEDTKLPSEPDPLSPSDDV
jgi:Zn ribbon nucleic-acid-binding protein